MGVRGNLQAPPRRAGGRPRSVGCLRATRHFIMSAGLHTVRRARDLQEQIEPAKLAAGWCKPHACEASRRPPKGRHMRAAHLLNLVCYRHAS